VDIGFSAAEMRSRIRNEQCFEHDDAVSIGVIVRRWNSSIGHTFTQQFAITDPRLILGKHRCLQLLTNVPLERKAVSEKKARQRTPLFNWSSVMIGMSTLSVYVPRVTNIRHLYDII